MLILWFFSFPIVDALATTEEVTKNLRQQMDELQAQIDSYRANISQIQQQKNTLNREISLLDAQIKAAGLEVQQVNLQIRQTESEIAEKNSAMAGGEQKLNRERANLAEYVRALYEADQRDLLEVFLADEKISAIFDEANSLDKVQKGIQESMANILSTRVVLEEDKAALEDKKEELNQLKVIEELQRRSIVAQQEEKKDILAQTKGQESSYQSMVKKVNSDIDAIKSQLYLLEGTGVSMPLFKAFQYAQRAGNLTGVRPAFLLAVLKKESSWGEKVGTGTWRKDMHTRDQKAFLQICAELNRDPDKTPVSRKPSYGWGGAMGPAQFLPAIWLSYKDQIADLTGHNPPDPWDIEDAFVAAGIKMAQAGANAKTEAAEWKAAQVYFAGSRWNKPAYYFYGDQVMEMTRAIQEQIDLISK